jgi:hypothetical protein
MRLNRYGIDPRSSDKFRTDCLRGSKDPMTKELAIILRVRNIIIGRLARLNEVPFEAGSDTTSCWVHWLGPQSNWRSIYLEEGIAYLTWRSEPEPPDVFTLYQEPAQQVEVPLQAGLMTVLREHLLGLDIKL